MIKKIKDLEGIYKLLKINLKKFLIKINEF